MKIEHYNIINIQIQIRMSDSNKSYRLSITDLSILDKHISDCIIMMKSMEIYGELPYSLNKSQTFDNEHENKKFEYAIIDVKDEDIILDINI